MLNSYCPLHFDFFSTYIRLFEEILTLTSRFTMIKFLLSSAISFDSEILDLRSATEYTWIETNLSANKCNHIYHLGKSGLPKVFPAIRCIGIADPSSRRDACRHKPSKYDLSRR